jgi:DNA mismatch repair protein MutS
MNTATNFESILFIKKIEPTIDAPPFFADLNLDQVISNVVYGKEEYDLKPFFYTPLQNEGEIIYRQKVMQDLEQPSVFNYLQTFAQCMFAMRQQLPNKKDFYYKYQKERFFLDAVNIYCDTVKLISESLRKVTLRSDGLLAFQKYLSQYVQSSDFNNLFNETKKLLTDLSSIKYAVLAKDLKVQVVPYRSETDYSEEVEKTFEKFNREAENDYRKKFEYSSFMNHVENGILEGVATLYPEIFKRLDDYNLKYTNYLDETINNFDREIEFYIAYIEYISKLKKAGLKFCYPEVSNKSKDIYVNEEFDIALAYQLVKENKEVVGNDFYLKKNERIIIVSGPNQGGKTTFARSFGQLHYLAALGCPVPGREAKLFLFDKLFTHFEKEENIHDLRSKLEDDIIRIHEILHQATSGSIIILNEILSSTTLQDAIFLSKKIMEKISSLDAICVWVTFIDELLLLSDKTVSMVSNVVPENPSIRTFKIERKPADGLAYALSIAEKHHVTYKALKERIK